MDSPIYMTLRNRTVLINPIQLFKPERNRVQQNAQNLQSNQEEPQDLRRRRTTVDDEGSIDVVLIHHSHDPVAIIDLTGD